MQLLYYALLESPDATDVHPPKSPNLAAPSYTLTQADMSPESMIAIAVSQFTEPSGYELQHLPRPTIQKDDDVIIKVHAAGVNPFDMKKANGVAKQVLKER